MIRIDEKIIELGRYPDNTLRLKYDPEENGNSKNILIDWKYENDEELFALYCLVKHIRNQLDVSICLRILYVPNARQDRCKDGEDVFTLKYFAEIINSLEVDRLFIMDPHSSVTPALFNNCYVLTPDEEIRATIKEVNPDILFFPDEGSMKRYSETSPLEYCFGVKRRDWKSGKILGLDVIGDQEKIRGNKVLIIDDICSRGGTFVHSARRLRELGAAEIYLFVTHCEDTVFNGELLEGDLIQGLYTTDSILKKNHEKIKVYKI